MSEMIEGECLCGTVAFEVENRFENLFFCHCEQCRKITGSAHASNLFRDIKSFRWIRGQIKVINYKVPGRGFSTAFCSKCGSGLPFVNSSGEKLIVPAGSLNAEPVFDHQTRIFCAEQAQWHQTNEKTRSFEKFPL